MGSISANRFRDNLKALVERVTTEHSPLKVTRRGGDSFVMISAEDWEREQESLYVLQNNDLMCHIAKSLKMHDKITAHTSAADQMNEITDL
ncbi:type II toxin-antitoxin system Phd/YefM family antitoxin [Salinisphaera aquimarina]|uniref:Antitoxin n=1 Tax=Salinisphaera aquimarina TaxID=2094031 RepID=A0ABV7EP36_9GAMM